VADPPAGLRGGDDGRFDGRVPTLWTRTIGNPNDGDVTMPGESGESGGFDVREHLGAVP